MAAIGIREWCLLGRRHLVRIVVVPGVIPQIRGYRSEGRGEVEVRVASW
jgi:hypothetical protein